MKLMIRVLLPLCLLTSLLLFDTARVAACVCVAGTPFITSVTAADTILTGKAIAQESSGTPDQGVYTIPFVIQVTKVWKGVNQPTIKIATSNSDCAYNFEVDKEYLIFAEALDGQLRADSCSRSQPLATAERDIALLDALFSPSALQAFDPAATITVHGEHTYLDTADQLFVRFVLAEGANEANFEKQRTQLSEALLVHNVPSTIVSSLYSDGKDFYVILRRTQFSDDELVTLLDQFVQNQTAISQASDLPIGRIEAMSGLADCTRPLVNAHRNALWNAQTRAELLAVLLGGRTDRLLAITEETPAGAAVDTVGICDALRWRQWHELPLTTELSAMMQITVPVSLQVTFGVKPLITNEALQPEGFAPATATPAFLSPLATPTPSQ